MGSIDVNEQEIFHSNAKPKFLVFCVDGLHNCNLWEFDEIHSYDKKIYCFKESVSFLLNECKDIQNEEKLYPIVFLLRNTVELCLKKIIYISSILGGEDNSCIKSHEIKKKLWKNVKKYINKYSGNNDKTNDIVELEKRLYEIDSIDKKGDTFRYPTTYSLEYKIKKEDVDVKWIVDYIMVVIDSLTGYSFQIEEYLSISSKEI